MITAMKNYRKQITLLILFLLLLMLGMGCRAQQINVTVDGQPLPEHVVVLTNPENGIRVTFAWVRVYWHTEGKERILWPDYLNSEKPHVINKPDTERLELHISVYNPNQIAYQMWESFELSYADQAFPTHIQKCFYDGVLSINNYTTRLPVDNGLSEVTASITVMNRSGQTYMDMGPVIYRPVD